MATMDSDWLRHFPLLLKNHCINCHQICHKCSSNGPAIVLLLFAEIQDCRHDSNLLRHFWLLKNHCIYWHQTCHKCSSSGLEEVLLLFVASEIQDCHHGLWLAETFSTFFQEPLHGQSTNLPQMFLLWSRGSVATFFVIGNPRRLPWTLICCNNFQLLKNHCVDNH